MEVLLLDQTLVTLVYVSDKVVVLFTQIVVTPVIAGITGFAYTIIETA
jgi:hypothetical protein